MDYWVKKISEVAHTLGAIVLGVLFLAVCVGVAARLMGVSLSAIQELSGYGAIWLTFLGVGYTLRAERQVRVDLITRMVPERVRAVMFFIGDLACLVFSIIMIYKGIYLVGLSHEVGRVTQLIRLPIYALQIILPVGFVVFALESIAHAVKSFVAISGKNGLKLKEGE